MAKATSTKKRAAKKSAAASNKSSSKKTTAKKGSKKAAIAESSAKKTTKTGTKKKAATKKSATQRAASKQSGQVLVCASDGECFWTSDGQILRDLTELRDALKEMNEAVYQYHVTKERNDFADWVEQVLMDAACAEALRKARKPKTARTVVVRHLRSYVG